MESLTNLVTMAYLAAGILFILSLSGLASQETARRGNLYGMVGMVVAIVAVLALSMAQTPTPTTLPLMLGALVLGGAVGAVLAARVAMTSMPQLVAALHSFVGLAAVLVGISTFLHSHSDGGVVELIEIYVDVALGAITFTGSVIAWAKLEGRMSGKPLLLPARHVLNAAVVVALLVIGVLFVQAGAPETVLFGLSGLQWLLVMTVLCSLLGIHLVVAIGGADMPVVVSLLNSYSGWTAAAAGFMLQNDLLIVTGALVGSSGAILSYIMCKAMNRSIWNVAFGGFGTTGAAPATGGGTAVEGEVQAIDVDGVATLLGDAKSVVVVPGYGMAVAQAQHLVNEFGELMRSAGVDVRFAIHPVAGRLPGHMNVLLAEAGVPYDIVLEMDEINDDLAETSVVLVIGANDIVNPGALEDASSPIFGMPVLEVWKANTVVVLKRGMATGYAGVGNPLFFKANTRMLFGDAKDSMSGLVGALRK
jgi:H+-translocating NAD(P) transhydrogenase subunit beta